MKRKRHIVLGLLIFWSSLWGHVYASVVINEFLPAPSSGNPEWVEFYNSDSSVEDLSNYYFDDDTNFDSDSGSSAKVALSGLLSSSSTCYLELSSFLNNNGDIPTIFKLDGSIADTYQYASTSADKSYARVPDGGGWQLNQTSTKSSLKCSDSAPIPTPTSTPTPMQTSTPTPTPAPTATPTPTPTKFPTPTPTKTPTPTLTESPTETMSPTETPLPQGEVLGTEVDETKPSTKPFIISLLFVSLGMAILSIIFVIKRIGIMIK